VLVFVGTRQAFLDEVVTTHLAPKLVAIQNLVNKATNVEQIVPEVMQAVLRTLTSDLDCWGTGYLCSEPVNHYLQQAIQILETELLHLEVPFANQLAVMSCTWAYGLAFTSQLIDVPIIKRAAIEIQVQEAGALLLAGHQKLSPLL